MPPRSNVLALDVGEQRIGVAIASAVAKLPAPLTTVSGDNKLEQIVELIDKNDASAVVVGLPRRLGGQDSSQTRKIRDFADELKARINVPLHFRDESVTSVRAEEELESRGKQYAKEDIDALSAVYILEDFFKTQA